MTKQNCINLIPEYPSSFDNFYGYAARAYNGSTEKSFNYVVNTSYEFGRYGTIASPAQNDTYEVSFLLKAGSYSLTLVYDKGASRGIASVYFDDLLLAPIDCYAASTSQVNRTTLYITTLTTGVHTIKIKMLSKNSSSSGYVFNCSGMFLSPVVSVATTRINCGGANYTDSSSNLWLADKYFNGGDPYDIESITGAFTVTGTNDQPLFKFERSLDVGSFNYTIPITSGIYTINLLFCENNKTAVGQRVGNITLNGTALLSNFDVFAQASGQRKALIKTFTNQSLSSFILNVSTTLINGIELIRTA